MHVGYTTPAPVVIITSGCSLRKMYNCCIAVHINLKKNSNFFFYKNRQLNIFFSLNFLVL